LPSKIEAFTSYVFELLDRGDLNAADLEGLSRNFDFSALLSERGTYAAMFQRINNLKKLAESPDLPIDHAKDVLRWALEFKKRTDAEREIARIEIGLVSESEEEAGGPRESGEEARPAGERGPDGLSDASRAAADTAHQHVVGGLRVMRAQFEELYQVWQALAETGNLAPDHLDDLQDQMDILERTSGEMITAEPDQLPSLGLEAVTTASVFDDGLVELRDAAATIATDSGNVRKALARISKIWTRTVKWLWNLISHLLTPKEWSLAGGVQMPGLAHASISVTFGSR
jgi:hypothetical protein